VFDPTIVSSPILA